MTWFSWTEPSRTTSELYSLNSVLHSLAGRGISSANMHQLLSLRINCPAILSQYHPDPITNHLPNLKGWGDAHFSTCDLQFSACELDHC